MRAALVLLSGVFAALSAFGGHGLLYTAPAEDSDRGWERQSLPIGCGHFGANVFGNVTNERVQVTYNALHNRDPNNPKKASLTDFHMMTSRNCATRAKGALRPRKSCRRTARGDLCVLRAREGRSRSVIGFRASSARCCDFTSCSFIMV